MYDVDSTFIRAIRPTQGRADRFSQNLYRWLRRHPHYTQVFFRRGNASSLGAPDTAYDPERTQASQIYVGLVDDGDLLGSRLSEILVDGAKTQTWCYPGFPCDEITEAFWAGYKAIGKCAIDPEHRLYADKERYRGDDTARVCCWCGRHEEAFTEARVVRQTVWLPPTAVSRIPEDLAL